MRSEIVTAWVWVNALPLPGNTPTWEPKARLRLAIARSVLDEPNAIYGDEDFEIIPMQLARVSEVNGSAFTVTTDDGTVVRVEDTHLAILALGTSSAATYAAWQAGTMAPFAWQRFELNQDGCDAYSSSRHMRRLEFALPAAAYDVIDAPVAASGTKLVQVHTSRGGLSLVCEPSTSAYPGCRAYLSAADIVDVDATRTIYAGAISHPSLETLRAWFPAEIELACNAGTCDFAFAQARP